MFVFTTLREYLARCVVPLVAAVIAMTFIAGCGSDDSGCDPIRCDGVCVDERCQSADAGDDIDGEDTDVDSDDGSPDGDGGDGQDTNDGTDSDADTGDTADADDSSDAQGDGGGDTSGGPWQATEMPLFEPCTVNAEFCSVAGAACLSRFSWSDGDGELELQDLQANYPRFDSLGGRNGICTQLCNGADDSVAGECAGLPGFRCQLVAVRDTSYPDDAAFPFDAELDPEELMNGSAWLGICVPPSDASVPGLCAGCIDDASCVVGRCVETADGSRRCATDCDDDLECPLGFVCGDADTPDVCLPVAGICGACLDGDSDGFGRGACANIGLDCDDTDAETWFRADTQPLEERYCEAGRDRNCNGIEDSVELSGPDSGYGVTHCTGCGEGCDIGDGPEANSQVACVDSAAGPTCAAVCSAGFADCNGDFRDGCETDLSDPRNCGGCAQAPAGQPVGVDCAAVASAGVSLVSCIEGGGSMCSGDVASDAGFSCAIGDVCSGFDGRCRSLALSEGGQGCEEGRGDCDGCFFNGCEADLEGEVANCGTCGTVCGEGTAIFDNVYAYACDDGACVRDAARTNGGCSFSDVVYFGDCDSDNDCTHDLSNDEDHCGACSAGCPPGESCIIGVCQAESCGGDRFVDCDGVSANSCEADLRADVHCGSCNSIDADPAWSTLSSTHACIADPNGGSIRCDAAAAATDAHRRLEVQCGGDDFDQRQYRCGSGEWTSGTNLLAAFEDDDLNCGGCGVRCSAGQSCVSGSCLGSGCPPMTGDCNGDGSGNDADGCEQRLDTPVHCGRCNDVEPNSDGSPARMCGLANVTMSECTVAPDGLSAECTIECANSREDCDGAASNGCEVRTSGLGAERNCGGCGVTCPGHEADPPVGGDNDLLSFCSVSGECQCVDVGIRELCNGVSELCSGVIDEGCPRSIAALLQYDENSREIVDVEQQIPEQHLREYPTGRIAGYFAGLDVELLRSVADTVDGDSTSLPARILSVTTLNRPASGTLVPGGALNAAGEYPFYHLYDPENSEADLVSGLHIAPDFETGEHAPHQDEPGIEYNIETMRLLCEPMPGQHDGLVNDGWLPVPMGIEVQFSELYPQKPFCQYEVGHTDYCDACGPCGRGDSDADQNASWGGFGIYDDKTCNCGPGLYCESTGGERGDERCLLPGEDNGTPGIFSPLMYRGLSGVRLLCGWARVVHDGSTGGSVTGGASRYVFETAQNPASPASGLVPVGSRASAGSLEPQAASTRAGVGLLDPVGRLEPAAPDLIADLWVSWNNAPYPHATATESSSAQRRSEAQARDYVFRALGATWHRTSSGSAPQR